MVQQILGKQAVLGILMDVTSTVAWTRSIVYFATQQTTEQRAVQDTQTAAISMVVMVCIVFTAAQPIRGKRATLFILMAVMSDKVPIQKQRGQI